MKFKKLAGCGYFKIINRSFTAALETLGYGQAEIEEIVAYAVGHGTLGNAPGITHAALVGHGFGQAQIDKIEAALPSAFDIRFVFNQWTLGEEFCTGTLGIPAEKLNDPGFDLLLDYLGRNREMEVALIAAQPATLEFGAVMSPAVEDALHRAADVIASVTDGSIHHGGR